MVLLIPVVSAILADTDGFISCPVLGDSLCFACVISLAANAQQCAGNKQENPEKNIDNPPPPTDTDFPQKPVALFFVVGFCLGNGFCFLVYLEADVVTSASGAYDAGHDDILPVFFLR